MNLSQNESVHGNLWVTEKPQRLFPSFLYTCTEVLICIKSSTRIFSFLPFVHVHLHRIIISNLYKEIYRCYRWRTGLSPSFFPCTCTKDLLLCYFPGTWCSPQRTYSTLFHNLCGKRIQIRGRIFHNWISPLYAEDKHKTHWSTRQQSIGMRLEETKRK